MTPKEKAKELIFNFGKIDHINDRCLPFKQSKQCAVIAVDEILGQFNYTHFSRYEDLNSEQKKTIAYFNSRKVFFEEVKQEINKL